MYLDCAHKADVQLPARPRDVALAACEEHARKDGTSAVERVHTAIETVLDSQELEPAPLAAERALCTKVLNQSYSGSGAICRYRATQSVESILRH